MVDTVPHERIVEGLAISPGIGIGRAYVFDNGGISIPEYAIAESELGQEQRRLREAVLRARRQVTRLRTRLRNRAKTMTAFANDELAYVLDAYLLMLKDSQLVRGAMQRIRDERVNAEHAVHAEMQNICEAFKQMEDAYLAARIEDIRDVGNRLLHQLNRQMGEPLLSVPKGSIIVASELTPADAARLDPENVAGIAAQVGGPQGHTAIMARALGLPAVLGAAGLLDAIKTGDHVLVDGTAGQIIVNPTPASARIYRDRLNIRRREEIELRGLRSRPAITRDGIAISLQANVELPFEMENVMDADAAGVGLLRTEFLFLNRMTMPTEEEQYASLRSLIEAARGRPVTVRTLDLGGGKASALVLTQYGENTQSQLGLRGIRLALTHEEILDTQFRAILRASVHGPVRILLPMVTAVAEVRAARDHLATAARKLHRRGTDIPTVLPPLGVMIEVPGAALTADALARVSDFFAIGSNDLTMYTLAIDRGDERVAHLYNPLNPGVLRMIQFSAAAALQARIPFSICGEIAGDPRFTALLLGLGFRELSMTASVIPRVKRRILDLDLASAERRVRTIMEQNDVTRIERLLDEFNALELETATS